MRVAPPDLPGAQTTDSPIDRALALLLANETEAALRWAAATVERDPSMPSALVITCRLLEQMGRPEAAVEGFELAVRRAIDGANLPLAVAAIGDLRALGRRRRQATSTTWRAPSAWAPTASTETEAPPPPLPNFEGFQPLSSFLTGPALTSKATQIIHAAKRDYDEVAGSEILLTAPLPLFSAMPKDALRDLVGAFEMITVPAGHAVIAEGEEGAEAYIVARGELEVLRRDGEEDGKPPIMLARLVSGALFGEMALLSRAPRAASVVATRPSILLVAKREALEDVAEGRPEVGVELAAHCRRRMVANLGRTSPVLVAVPPQERTMLVERFETRIFEKGEKLVDAGAGRGGAAPRRVGPGRRRGARRRRVGRPRDALAGRDGRRGRARPAPQGERGRHRGAPDGDAVSPARGVHLAHPGPPGRPPRPLHDGRSAGRRDRASRSTTRRPRWRTTTCSCDFRLRDAGGDHGGRVRARARARVRARCAGDRPRPAFTAQEARQARRLALVIAIVVGFFVLELGGAILADSVVLQADALHLLMDVLALGVSLFAMRLAVRRPTPRFTYGLRRAEPVAAIFSAVLVLSTTVVHRDRGDRRAARARGAPGRDHAGGRDDGAARQRPERLAAARRDRPSPRAPRRPGQPGGARSGTRPRPRPP